MIVLKWIDVEDTIRKECERNNRSKKYTNKLVSYAMNLFEKNLPIIVSPSHFSALVGLEHQYVCNMAYGTEKFYRHFTIPKKNGERRPIDEPLPDLKFVQRWILHNILERCEISKYAKAYYKGRTLKHNARFHRKQKVVVTMDIKNFFQSIHISDIIHIFDNMGYNHNLSCFLAHLCCLNDKIPQGASTSPYLSNLKFVDTDNEIVKFTSENNIHYTRYADDLTFSGDFKPSCLIKDISKTIYKAGFSINSKKTRVARRNARQEVTGIVVNSHMQISREKRKLIRQQMYYIKKYGLESHLGYLKETRANYLEHLLGQIGFAIHVNPKDIEMKDYFDFVKNILKEYK